MMVVCERRRIMGEWSAQTQSDAAYCQNGLVVLQKYCHKPITSTSSLEKKMDCALWLVEGDGGWWYHWLVLVSSSCSISASKEVRNCSSRCLDLPLLSFIAVLWASAGTSLGTHKMKRVLLWADLSEGVCSVVSRRPWLLQPWAGTLLLAFLDLMKSQYRMVRRWCDQSCRVVLNSQCTEGSSVIQTQCDAGGYVNKSSHGCCCFFLKEIVAT